MPLLFRAALLALLAFLVPAGSGTAQDKKKEQKFCPVMTQDEIDPNASESVEYMGVKVFLCCDTCVAKWKRDPAAYADPKLIPGLEGKKLPPRDIPQVYCPVYPDRRVSSKDPSTTYQGVKVYFFNDMAKKRFEADPVKYAKAEILPQLPKK
jgi:YHS domain-containing protein